MDFSSSSSSLYKAAAKPPISDTSSAYTGVTATLAGGGGGGGERERMFEKVVTPSDVGKLNRLVIPKQHAEKYFPLDAAAGEKGLLLNFEECRSSGKSWRFRYSYWSSSQSYVITKGWSRFVKDKKLDAGDVVSFFRSFAADDSINGARLYIDWSRRRRPDQRSATLQFHHGISLNPWCYNYSPATPPALQLMGVRPFPPYHHHHHQGAASVFEPAPPISHHRRDLSNHTGSLFGGNYGVITQNSCLHHGSAVFFEARGGHCQVGSGAGAGPTAFESLPVANEKAAPKRLRLFGVNMDCTTTTQEDHEDCNDDIVVWPSSRVPPSSSSTLQHRHNSTSDATTINFLGKGKSSMSLDFDL